MTKIENILYTAKAQTAGGRDNGVCRTDDGRVQVRLFRPEAPGAGTNPEQLFAVGWPACFLSAVRLVAGKRKVALPSDSTIDAEVDLGLAKGVHQLGARLNVTLPAMDERNAQALVEAASHVCPYSLRRAATSKWRTTRSPPAPEKPNVPDALLDTRGPCSLAGHFAAGAIASEGRS